MIEESGDVLSKASPGDEVLYNHEDYNQDRNQTMSMDECHEPHTSWE
jgi:hypothetical protein